MRMLRAICFSCLPACTAPDPADPLQRAFLADAIVSNPVSYGHIHVAEAVGVPLHIMFPQPWSPTRAFPHPLSTTHFESAWSRSNWASYLLVDQFMWLGLGSMLNAFRSEALGLAEIRAGQRGRALLNDNKVPISHMWSPAFVPPCRDWPSHVDVVGEFRPLSTGPEALPPFEPAAPLQAFLDRARAAGDKPLFVGFGSMVLGDGEAEGLLRALVKAAELREVFVLLQNGWTRFAEPLSLPSPRVLVVGAMPHDWLFTQVRLG